MFKELDPLLHSQLRLAIMSVLMSVEEADFNYLKDKTEATPGNLSVQVNKLKDAGYITVKKSFKNNYPHTTCKVAEQGINAFENYVSALKQYLNPGD
jgi:DNA-binding MarR family transcriptional regulator